MTKWEYLIVDADAERMKHPEQQWHNQLHEHGTEGWELVTIKEVYGDKQSGGLREGLFTTSSAEITGYKLFFKRPVDCAFGHYHKNLCFYKHK